MGDEEITKNSLVLHILVHLAVVQLLGGGDALADKYAAGGRGCGVAMALVHGVVLLLHAGRVEGLGRRLHKIGSARLWGVVRHVKIMNDVGARRNAHLGEVLLHHRRRGKLQWLPHVLFLGSRRRPGRRLLRVGERF